MRRIDETKTAATRAAVRQKRQGVGLDEPAPESETQEAEAEETQGRRLGNAIVRSGRLALRQLRIVDEGIGDHFAVDIADLERAGDAEEEDAVVVAGVAGVDAQEIVAGIDEGGGVGDVAEREIVEFIVDPRARGVIASGVGIGRAVADAAGGDQGAVVVFAVILATGTGRKPTIDRAVRGDIDQRELARGLEAETDAQREDEIAADVGRGEVQRFVVSPARASSPSRMIAVLPTVVAWR